MIRFQDDNLDQYSSLCRQLLIMAKRLNKEIVAVLQKCKVDVKTEPMDVQPIAGKLTNMALLRFA